MRMHVRRELEVRIRIPVEVRQQKDIHEADDQPEKRRENENSWTKGTHRARPFNSNRTQGGRDKNDPQGQCRLRAIFS
jgi:hypothetical protein